MNTKKYGLSIDPGMSTGACLFSWSDEQDGYFRQEELWQFTGGATAIAKFLDWHNIKVFNGAPRLHSVTLSTLVVEKFTPRGGAGFSLTQDSAEPLRGEGVLIGRGFEPFIQWGEPSQQYFMGGEDFAERRRRSREFLKINGLYVTGKQLGQPDADDAISAELHAIAWLRRKRHLPTLVEFFGPDDEEGE